jgi:type I restriction enzyme, S subunit
VNAPLRPRQVGSPWPRVRLSELAEHRLGKMLDKAKNTGAPRRYLRNPNVRWFDVDLSDLQEILVEEKDVHKYELRYGDVIICEGGEAGRSAFWKGEAEGIIFQKACHRVRVGPKLDARFLIHRLMYDYFNGGLDDYYTGATIKHFTGQDLARYEIPLPPPRRAAADRGDPGQG